MEAGSDNLALVHCSCLHACLATYSNILGRDLNTMYITINRGVTSRQWDQSEEVRGIEEGSEASLQ